MMRSVFSQGAWHLEIEVLLISFNNVYIISFEKLHKETVDNKVENLTLIVISRDDDSDSQILEL